MVIVNRQICRCGDKGRPEFAPSDMFPREKRRCRIARENRETLFEVNAKLCERRLSPLPSVVAFGHYGARGCRIVAGLRL